jgi:hypothetical protein
MPIKIKEFIVIRVHNELGFDFEQGQMIRNIIISCNSTDFEFMNPGTFWIYFLKNEENETFSRVLISKLNTLKLNKEWFSKVSIKQSEGPLIASFSLFGKYKGGPLLGKAVTKLLDTP